MVRRVVRLGKRSTAALRQRAGWLLLSAAATGPAAAWATASLPWTPSAFARHQLQLLVDDAALALPVTQWPLPRAAVAQALDALPALLPPALDEARAQVRAELRQAAAPGAALTLRGPQEGLAGFGDDALPGSSGAVRSGSYQGDNVAAQLGLRLGRPDESDGGEVNARLEGSAIAGEWHGVQLQAWSRRGWWGPGWQNSLVLGNNAPALTGVGLQRALAGPSTSPWLSWLGPWNLEFFVAQLDDVAQPARPFLIGNRLTLRPLPGLELGLSRTAQWGGQGREQSLRSFFEALTGSGTNATPDDAQAGIDPASQLAGFDLRQRCPSSLRCAGYLQLMGEDLAGGLPSRYMGLYGIEAWSADGRHRWFGELAETGCRMPIGKETFPSCAYRNYAYPGGYVSARRWLGAGVGPDSRVLTLGWLDSAAQRTLRLHWGTVGSRIGTYSAASDDPQTSGHLIGIAARQAFRWGSLVVEPELSWLRIRAPAGAQVEARLGVTVSLAAGGTP